MSAAPQHKNKFFCIQLARHLPLRGEVAHARHTENKFSSTSMVFTPPSVPPLSGDRNA